MLKKVNFIMFGLFFCLINLSAWDRYTNESEQTIGTYSFQKIMRYSFSVSGTSTVSLETKNTTGYTYMYLWSNTESRQISQNDDGGVGYEAKYFADNLDANQSIWESWKNANRSATRTVEHWL